MGGQLGLLGVLERRVQVPELRGQGERELARALEVAYDQAPAVGAYFGVYLL